MGKRGGDLGTINTNWNHVCDEYLVVGEVLVTQVPTYPTQYNYTYYVYR